MLQNTANSLYSDYTINECEWTWNLCQLSQAIQISRLTSVCYSASLNNGMSDVHDQSQQSCAIERNMTKPMIHLLTIVPPRHYYTFLWHGIFCIMSSKTKYYHCLFLKTIKPTCLQDVWSLEVCVVILPLHQGYYWWKPQCHHVHPRLSLTAPNFS